MSLDLGSDVNGPKSKVVSTAVITLATITAALSSVVPIVGLTLDCSGTCKTFAVGVLAPPVTGVVTLRTPYNVTGTHSPVVTVGPGHGAHNVTD